MVDRESEFYHKRFGAHLKATRESLSVVQAELAAKTGLDIGTISRFENGRQSPTLVNLRLIAEALGLPTKDLLDFED